MHRIYPDLRTMVGASWNSQVQTVEAFPALSKISGDARPYGSLNFGKKPVVIGVFLLEHADVASPSSLASRSELDLL